MRNGKIKFLPIRGITGASEIVISWVLDTWGDPRNDEDVDLKHRIEGNGNNPEAIIAVLKDIPVGVVTFRRYNVPGGERDALWIDALYVHAKHRRCGIGSELIQIAEGIAASSEERIFAFTDIPKIYEAQDWSLHQKDSETRNWIVTKSFQLQPTNTEQIASLNSEQTRRIK